MELAEPTELRRKSGVWGTPGSATDRSFQEHWWGFAPSFSSHVRPAARRGRFGERGAPVFPSQLRGCLPSFRVGLGPDSFFD